jgi:hypothetical protein
MLSDQLPSGWTIFDLWHLRAVAPRSFLVTSHAEGLERYARIWAENVRHPVIPFDLAERRRVLAHAYEKLAPYIAAHEELLKQGITNRPTSTTEQKEPDDG